MKRPVSRLVLLAACVLSLAACSGGQVQPIFIDLSPNAPPAAEPPSRLAMPLADKVGQMFVVEARGAFMNEASPAFLALKHQVVDNRVGGVIWASRSEVYETASLTRKLQALAKVPLLFSADFEAGAGMRLDDVTYGPWAMALAAAGDVSLAGRRARATGEEARALGIGQVLAPVADVNDNPENPVINVRSFGEDPLEVGRFVAAYVRGLQDAGVLATLKHFPGHGDTSADSHRALPVLTSTRERLDAVELVPFREGLKAGARSVMVAHLAVPALDPTPAPPLPSPPSSQDATSPVAASEVERSGTMPASLSAPITSDLLRKELGFGGLVVTDSMRMGGIVAHFTVEEAAIRAILAGADQILTSPDADKAVAAVVAAVKSGRVSEKRIDESVDRIMAEKRRLRLDELRSPSFEAIFRIVGSPEHEAIEEEIARRSMTLVREEAGVLPLEPASRLLSVVVADEATLNGPAGTLGAELKKRIPGVVTLRLDPRSTPDEVQTVVEAAKDADVVLVSLFVRARSGQGKIVVPDSGKNVIPQLLASGKPVVAVAFGSPYLIRDFPDLPTYLCAWGAQDVIQTAAARALFGEAPIEGHLPVTIPGIAKRGAGITKPAVLRPAAARAQAIPAAAVAAPPSPSKKTPGPPVVSLAVPASAPPRAFVGATLVDGTGAAPVPDAVVLVRGGRIDCAGRHADCPVPEGVAVTDLKGAWITPGLIDAHVHFSQTGWADGRPDAFDVRKNHPYENVESDLKAHPQRFFRSYVCSGVTSVFDVGGYPWTLSLPALAENDTFAPRVVAAGPLLSTLDHWLNLPAERQFIHLKDEESARTGVRYLKAEGSSAVKVWYIVRPDLPVETSAPAVLAAGEEARKNGLPLIVHATGLAEAKVALKAGAKLLVHSVGDHPVDEEFLDLAKKNGTIYCPTMVVGPGYARLAEAVLARRAPTIDDPNGCVDPKTRALMAATTEIAPDSVPQRMKDRMKTLPEQVRIAAANLRRVRDAGIPIAMGTDAGNPLTLHGPSVYAEMEAMQAAGMTPMEVLVASTKGGSRAMGRARDIGTIEKGKLADLLILGADPTADIANARKVRAVVRGGVLRSIEELHLAVAAESGETAKKP